MNNPPSSTQAFKRYHIETRPAPDIVKWPSRFRVDVSKVGLAKHLIKEFIEYKGDLDIVLSRPCMYGVFSGPVGGFAPREQLCVGCLRCTTQHPDFVTIRHNPERRLLGDSYFTFDHINAVSYESSMGMIPVRGAGYRGKFGGEGWDGMWTDMSEIVRPTRDGIHGREFISTVVDIGAKPSYLQFDDHGQPINATPTTFTLPLPMLLDTPPHAVATSSTYKLFAQAAAQGETMVFLPLNAVVENNLRGAHIVPLVRSGDAERLRILPDTPKMIALEGWDADLFAQLADAFPQTLICLRTPFLSADEYLALFAKGVRLFHLTANYHGRGNDERFVLDLIRDAHLAFVARGLREEVTLIGSGGVIAAEHVPKAIIAGLDAVALDTPLLVALQATFRGEVLDRERADISLPSNLTLAWGTQRIMNLLGTWRDQMLEILGAMGLREVRRLRGEIGRAMFQIDLEREAFAEIEGYPG